MKEKRLPGLIAHAEHNISTGKLEGFNNKIKVSKKIGYGYRDDDFFFLLVRFIPLPAIRQNSPWIREEPKQFREEQKAVLWISSVFLLVFATSPFCRFKHSTPTAICLNHH